MLVLGLAASLPAVPQPQLPLFYRLAQKLGMWITPVPLIYAHASSERESYDAMTSMLLALARPDDYLVLVNREGVYCVFRVTAAYSAVPALQNAPHAPDEFATLASRYQRIWVVLDDPRAGWQAQPPPAIAATLASQYMNLPLPLPTYFSDAALVPGSTNFWLVRATLLQRIADLSPDQLNPRFFLDLSQTYRRFGDPSNAVAALTNGVTAFPADPYLQRRLAECYYDDLKDYQRAIDHNRILARNYRLRYAIPMYEALFNTALCYQNLGDTEKAQMQYVEVLSTLDEFPDALWESRTRRYLGNLLLTRGLTNDALQQFQLDLRLRAQHPGYSYDRLLGLYDDLRRPDAYARTARTFFDLCGSNDVRAIARYLPVLRAEPQHAVITSALASARVWLSRDAALKNEFRRNAAWWTAWTNMTLSHGLAPEQ